MPVEVLHFKSEQHVRVESQILRYVIQFSEPLPAIMFFISALLSLPCIVARVIFFVSIVFTIWMVKENSVNNTRPGNWLLKVEVPFLFKNQFSATCPEDSSGFIVIISISRLLFFSQLNDNYRFPAFLILLNILSINWQLFVRSQSVLIYILKVYLYKIFHWLYFSTEDTINNFPMVINQNHNRNCHCGK